MIILKDKDTKQTINFELTKFPDGTSQCWKLNPMPSKDNIIQVIWMFENESELIHVLQIAHLLKRQGINNELIVPFLPYSRQDKDITNDTTFARETFLKIVDPFFDYIQTFDCHSWDYRVASIYPTQLFQDLKHHIVVFPDKGAADRYSIHVDRSKTTIFYCDKIRNQLTGEIEGLKIIDAAPGVIAGCDVVIVDDICDGGRTFIEVAKALKEYCPNKIDLVVTHGIFSKGVEVLYNAGIDNIYTTNSLMRNKPGNGVWHSPNLVNQDKKYGFNVYKVVDIEYNNGIDLNSRYSRKMV